VKTIVPATQVKGVVEIVEKVRETMSNRPEF